MNDPMIDANGENQEKNEFEFPLVEYLRLLLSKVHWILIAAILLGGIAFAATYYFVKPQYSASVTIFVSATDQQDTSVSSSTIQAGEKLAQTYAEIMRRPYMADAVIDQLDLISVYGDRQTARKNIKNMISVSIVNNTQLISVQITASDPKRACDIANAFGEIGPGVIKSITTAGVANQVDFADVASPVSRGTVRNAIVGALIGIVAVAAYYAIRMISDTTLCIAEDIEKVSNITILGQVPDFPELEKLELRWELHRGEVIGNASEEKDTGSAQ